ncbi:30S ribosomal protein S20 [Buchnera aphidicola]|uniref:Small ribosomal subunit protein bS20 n=1 Tax=Buchnera aphidicola (Cinara strobi) TaxID=1921549 RepID=A0A3B1DVR8_9GAMM|nr:30S ribosomal protein S20 [Buchnera aphidicola]VAX76363.1 30S ribosomal protein S20 [Buchnera aphidicola (Cinara strobi)]
MANINSSKKHAILSEQRRKNNSSKRSQVKTFMKKIYKFIKEKKKEKAIQIFYVLQSIIDRYSLKGVMHANKAARYKSKIMKDIFKI